MEKVFLVSTVGALGVTGFVGLGNILISFLAAQGATAPSEIVGTTGWVGAGLLGLVLAWLLGIHLPAKDKQIRELLDTGIKQMEVKDAQLEKFRAEYNLSIKLITDEFRGAIRDVTTLSNNLRHKSGGGQRGGDKNKDDEGAGG